MFVALDWLIRQLSMRPVIGRFEIAISLDIEGVLDKIKINLTARHTVFYATRILYTLGAPNVLSNDN